MRTLSKNLSLLAIATAALVGTAFADEAAKEVTLTGTQQCAKCSLKEEGAKSCQDVLTVNDGTAETKYYLVKNDAMKGKHVCTGKKANVKNERQYEALKDKGMSKERAARIANSPGASSRGGKKSGSGGSSSQGGTTAQKKAAGRKGGRATARKR